MWFLPTYNRPDFLGRMAHAPGGLPPDLLVILTKGDPSYDRSKGWADKHGFETMLAAEGARYADLLRLAFAMRPNEPGYGVTSDDHWPVTTGWWKRLEEAAEDIYFAHSAISNDTSPLAGAHYIGGNLVRAMGGLVPTGCKCRHNWIDNIYRDLGETYSGLIRPVQVEVQHRHWIHGLAEKDETYSRGSSDMDEDRRLYVEWSMSDDKWVVFKAVAALLGRNVSEVELSKVNLAVCTPVGDHMLDEAYVQSFLRFMAEAFSRRLNVMHLVETGASHIGKVRDQMLWDAVRRGATHILFIDSDMGFSPRLPLRFIAADVDVAAAVGVRKTADQRLCCNFFDHQQELHPVNRFLKIKDVGFAFTMLKREVALRMAEAFPQLAYEGKGGDLEHALFMDMITEGRTRLSEDYAFCHRWRAIGGEIWADRHAALIHAGRKEYTGSINEFFKGADKVDMTIASLVDSERYEPAA